MTGSQRKPGEGMQKSELGRPSEAEAHYNQANLFRKLNRFEEALAAYDLALALVPQHHEAHFNRANVLRDLRRREEALESYNRALILKPDFVEALINRGALLQRS